MNDHDPTAPRARWLRVALGAALLYVLIGRAFTLPVEHARFWRLAAWAVSGIVFALHLGYGHFALRAVPRAVALHAALAAALGAFGLAAIAMLRSLPVEHTVRPVWLLALVLWPAITAVPAYLVGLAVALVLARFWPRA